MRFLNVAFVLFLILSFTTPAFAMFEDDNPFKSMCFLNGGNWVDSTNPWGGSSGFAGYCSYPNGGLFGAIGDWYHTDYDGSTCGYTEYRGSNGLPVGVSWGDSLCKMRHGL